MTVKDNEENIKQLKVELNNYASGLETINERITTTNNRIDAILDIINKKKESDKKK